jgi:hypothetical protein
MFFTYKEHQGLPSECQLSRIFRKSDTIMVFSCSGEAGQLHDSGGLRAGQLPRGRGELPSPVASCNKSMKEIFQEENDGYVVINDGVVGKYGDAGGRPTSLLFPAAYGQK